MLYSLGGFKFESAVLLESLSRTTEYGIQQNERINNHAALFAGKKETETIELSCRTLPAQGAKNNALEPLYKLAKGQKSYSLVCGTGKVLGKFAIGSIAENQSLYLDNGLFLAQTFTMSLIRDF
jgi:phage protein U